MHRLKWRLSGLFATFMSTPLGQQRRVASYRETHQVFAEHEVVLCLGEEPEYVVLDVVCVNEAAVVDLLALLGGELLEDE